MVHRYRAVYTYVPQNKDELELHEGDLVYVIEKCDDGWFVGTSQRTKEIGTFPGNYVNKLWSAASLTKLLTLYLRQDVIKKINVPYFLTRAVLYKTILQIS